MQEAIHKLLIREYGEINVTRLTGGYTNKTYLLEGNDLLAVAKLAAKDNRDVQNELHSLARLQNSPIVPRVLEVVEFNDVTMILMEYRPGVNVQSFLDKEEWDQVAELYKQLGEFLALEIHSNRYSGDPHGIRLSTVHLLKEKGLHLDFVPEPLVRQSLSLLSLIGETETEWVLTHGDFGPHNVLAEEAGSITLLDWEWAEWAHPLHDVAWMCWFTSLHYPQQAGILCEQFLHSYKSHSQSSVTPELLKAYSVTKVWNVLQRVRHAPEHVQQEWVRRLEWTLNRDFEFDL